MTALGPLCKRGHARAVYERRCERAGAVPTRYCLACNRVRRQERRSEQQIGRSPYPLVLINQGDMERRILAARKEAS